MKNLNINNREGSNNSLRRKGLLPGVLYGEKIKNTLFEISEMELASELAREGSSGICNVHYGNEEFTAIVKEVQKDPVTRKIIHIDLEQIAANDEVTSEVPLNFIGEGVVESIGGVVVKEKEKLKVKGPASAIPSSISIDVSKLKYGETITGSDVEFGGEISLAEDGNSVLAVILHKGNAVEEEKESAE